MSHSWWTAGFERFVV
ncbi:hypothetical protein LINPERPRIM_LOCUS577 [Linum perenne]